MKISANYDISRWRIVKNDCFIQVAGISSTNMLINYEIGIFAVIFKARDKVRTVCRVCAGIVLGMPSWSRVPWMPPKWSPACIAHLQLRQHSNFDVTFDLRTESFSMSLGLSLTQCDTTTITQHTTNKDHQSNWGQEQQATATEIVNNLHNIYHPPYIYKSDKANEIWRAVCANPVWIAHNNRISDFKTFSSRRTLS